MDDLPAIHKKLQRLRWAARSLAAKGYKEQAIELMRISRGDVKIESGETLFDMSPAELDSARSCVTKERLRWAASYVLMRKSVESEDEVVRGTGWPKGRTKGDTIADAAERFNVSPSSLERYTRDADCPNDRDGIRINYLPPDWHPDMDKELFEKG
jgi:hypothetical protein